MSDRIHSLTVTFEKPIKDEDAEKVINAIKVIRGVSDVQPEIADAETYMAIEAARRELGKELLAVLYPDTPSRPHHKGRA